MISGMIPLIDYRMTALPQIYQTNTLQGLQEQNIEGTQG
jgi:hypothetical protein